MTRRDSAELRGFHVGRSGTDGLLCAFLPLMSCAVLPFALVCHGSLRGEW